MTDRETLARRIEAATGPDRELDVEIGVLRREVEWRDGFLMKLHPRMGSTDDICHNPRAYTASLDAAMMLVPEGCLHMAKTVWANPDLPTEATAGYASVDRYIRDDLGLWWKENFLSIAATPALALAAAAIRAGGA